MWTGSVDAQWINKANWSCEAPGAEGPQDQGFPNGIGHTAIFDGADPTAIPVVLPMEEVDLITVGDMSFSGAKGYSFTGGVLTFQNVEGDDPPGIVNSPDAMQTFDLTVHVVGIEFTVTGSGPVSIDTLTGSGLEVSNSVDVTIAVFEVNGTSYKIGEGVRLITEVLNRSSNGTLNRCCGDAGLYRIEATGESGPISHTTPSGSTEIAPAGGAAVGTIEPQASCFCSDSLVMATGATYVDPDRGR